MFRKDRIKVVVVSDRSKCHPRERLALEPARHTSRHVLELEKVKFSSEQPLACDCGCHPAGVDGDPSPTPLLCDRCRGPATASRVKDEVTRASRHQHAPLDHLRVHLDNIDSVCGAANIVPVGAERNCGSVRPELHHPYLVFLYDQPFCCASPRETRWNYTPMAIRPRMEIPALESKRDRGRSAESIRSQWVGAPNAGTLAQFAVRIEILVAQWPPSAILLFDPRKAASTSAARLPVQIEPAKCFRGFRSIPCVPEHRIRIRLEEAAHRTSGLLDADLGYAVLCAEQLVHQDPQQVLVVASALKKNAPGVRQQFQRRRALSGHDPRVVERGRQRAAGFLQNGGRDLFPVLGGAVVGHNPGAVFARRFHLDAGRVFRHHDGRPRAHMRGGDGHRLSVVAGGIGNDAAPQLLRCQRQNQVGCAPDFECSSALQVFALEKDPPSVNLVEQRRRASHQRGNPPGGFTDVCSLYGKFRRFHVFLVKHFSQAKACATILTSFMTVAQTLVCGLLSIGSDLPALVFDVHVPLRP